MIGRGKDHLKVFLRNRGEMRARARAPGQVKATAAPAALNTYGLCLKTYSDAYLHAIFLTIMLPQNGA